MYRSYILKFLYCTSLTLLPALSLQCITYTRFPEAKVDNPVKAVDSEDVLYYRVQDYSFFKVLGGAKAMQGAIKRKGLFRNTESVNEDVHTGRFVKITVTKVDPHLAALAFGYISVSLLTIVPFWSTEDGYDIKFEVFRDGKKLRAFEYEIRRSGFIWIAMLPFAWVNAFTYSEAEAFEATTWQFFDDARALLL